MYPVSVDIPGLSLDANIVENFLYGYLGVVGYCGILVCPGPGTLSIPKILFRIFASHNLESNPFRIGPIHNLLVVCHHSSNHVSVGIGHHPRTGPRLVIAHLELNVLNRCCLPI